ncbi:unnamed protein product [Phytophthora fragariaefolia]|uniref:Unnamed protein product n=1 Tax=Phytophthora fragariaefolia TaxID=1490495 RepID=A0A9W6Y6Z4_9STRA|nr:unnamed protein product [Phytophthora fragariaefolia]
MASVPPATTGAAASEQASAGIEDNVGTARARATPKPLTKKKKPARMSTGHPLGAGKRKTFTDPRAASKRQRHFSKREASTDNTPSTMEHLGHPIPEAPVLTTSTSTGAALDVSMDDFDSDNFLDALKRECHFGPLPGDDVNLGHTDWQLAIDSDTEGDEDGILLDEDDHEDGTETRSDELSDDEAVHKQPEVQSETGADDVSIEFDMTGDALDQLQINGWDTFDEHQSNQVLLDAAPLYDGPSGPTRAALAYAESPLAIFYFFLLKELWRKIAKETNQYREESMNVVAEGMRTRALARRRLVPSTVVLSVDEYKSKLRRKHPIQPHELVRFIGLLIARTLEPRRENPSRHWVTKTEGHCRGAHSGSF